MILGLESWVLARPEIFLAAAFASFVNRSISASSTSFLIRASKRFRKFGLNFMIRPSKRDRMSSSMAPSGRSRSNG